MTRTLTPREPAVTSRIMAAVHGRDTKPELQLRRLLHKKGLRFRVDARDVLGRPDIVNRRRKIAVFVDGDFWHANPAEWQRRGFNRMEDQFPPDKRDFWVEKLKRNVARDLLVTDGLVDEGWLVMRFWESQVAADAEAIADEISSKWRIGG